MSFNIEKDFNDSLGSIRTGIRIGRWIVDSWRKRAERKQQEREIRHTRETGMPSPDTALGRKAREVAQAEEEKLLSPPAIHGSARWGTADDASDMIGTQPGDELFLGRLMNNDGSSGPPLVARYPGHLLTVAGTGQGKSATQIVFNLLTYTGSVVVIDPKGELFDLTAARRRQFGKVFRLAPLARAGQPPSDRYNPLDELGDEREIANRARRLAEMLIVRQGDKGAAEATFFENEAINLLTVIIIGVCEAADRYNLPEDRTLAEVRRVCSMPILGEVPNKKNKKKEQANKQSTLPDEPKYLQDILLMFAEDGRNVLLRQQSASFAAYDRKLLASFISEINSNLAFFDGHAGFSEATSASDFRFEDLAREPTTVYLTIPLKDIGTSYRYLRTMIGQAFSALEEQQEATRASVLFILDEFPALRDMSFMRDAVAQMRSAGAWFWFFVQDLAQLKAVYGHSDVFLSQTDYQVFFGAVNDTNTKKYISTALGVGTIAYRQENISWSHNVGVNGNESIGPTQPANRGDGKNVGQSVNINAPVQFAARPLLTPAEVGMFLGQRRQGESHPSTSIILSKKANGFPLRARRIHWRSLLPQAQPLPEQQQSTAIAPVRR